MKRSLSITILSLLGMSLAADAAKIVWCSDNGAEGSAGTTGVGIDGNVLGAYYPPVSAGAPYVDQGFVDLLTAAGHQVTRFNPNSGALSIDDVAVLNTFDLVIVGTAMNSGPFNLNARGPKWNTLITKPMIVTKSTLIRRDRMGWLLSNFEYDSAANTSTTSSGKLSLLYPDNPIFCGITHTNVGGTEIMNNFCGILPSSPLNNRGTSTQFFTLFVSGADQGISNPVETGGNVLATIDFNPLDPGVNIPAGQPPAANPDYQATGYAIAEWPAGTLVRSTQVFGGEPLGGYRLFFGCGTRDAAGSVTSAPNPQAGALDLTLDGQKMFLNAVGRALSQPLALSGTWSQYDKTEIVNGPPGILALSDELATGFTAAVGENTLDVDGVAGVDQPGRPRIFQTFTPQALSKVGQRATLRFKIKFNDIPASGDTQFRFGFADTAHNQAVLTMIDIGATDGGSTWRLRPDISITGSRTADAGNNLIRRYVDGDWSDFGNTGRADFIIDATGARVPLVDPATNAPWALPKFQQGGTFNGSGGLPNGIGLVDTTTTHSFEMTLERVATGIIWSFIWGNDAGPDVVTGTSNPVVDDSYLPMNSVDGIGFVILNNAPFGPATTGSFLIADVSITAEGGSGSALPFKITHNVRSGTDETITWNSVPCTSYSVYGTTDLANPTVWTRLTGPTQADSYTTSVTIPGQTGPKRFYQVRRE